MFIQTEDTPNPESLKFFPGRPVLNATGQLNTFYATKSDSDEIARSPLAKNLFDVNGVKSVYMGTDYVAVTKYAEHHWIHVQAQIFSAMMNHFASGKPAVSEFAKVADTTIFSDDCEIVAMIKQLLETKIRPAVQGDGGDIRFAGFDPQTGIVSVRLVGACVGCPSSTVTLKLGVENMLMHYIPEVNQVLKLD
eukprot:CAMPEP_0194175200 /NCGR_PEP_ID=MMETSP0154-20130528/9279_1 /TAXON_ID=1049557 /ORGANISM="Thalassiothrix antarctica, Strain L6-D1" /LENGTH=192 /DNA_ID=CAMNT_0038888919 /DNA_START=169 /DNA_END=747 /DNA_ORIENTATION=-